MQRMTEPVIEQLPYDDNMYRTVPETVSFFARIFPELAFYSRFIAIIFRGSAKAKRSQYSDAHWCQSSYQILGALESVGCHFKITGLEYLKQLETPCVVIGNHMSVLETGILPTLVQPFRKVTFIIKDSLMDYPVFKHIMRSRNPIVVGRVNPRQDFKAVMEGGMDRLKKGISIIVFPQTTRTRFFEPANFNSIGVKLAQRAKVPIVPLALLTDAWGNGKYLKDFGKINPARNIHFAFGKPMWVQGRGADEHQKIIEFISGKLHEWKITDQSAEK